MGIHMHPLNNNIPFLIAKFGYCPGFFVTDSINVIVCWCWA